MKKKKVKTKKEKVKKSMTIIKKIVKQKINTRPDAVIFKNSKINSKKYTDTD